MTDFNIADINATDAWSEVGDKPFADIFAGSSIRNARFEFKRFLRDLYVTPRSISTETFSSSTQYEVSLFEHTSRRDEEEGPTRSDFKISVRVLIDTPQLVLSIVHDGSSYIQGNALPAINGPEFVAAYKTRQHAFERHFWMLCRMPDVHPGEFSHELCRAVLGYEGQTLAEVRHWLTLTIQGISDAIARTTWQLDAPSMISKPGVSGTDSSPLFACSAWISVTSATGTP